MKIRWVLLILVVFPTITSAQKSNFWYDHASKPAKNQLLKTTTELREYSRLGLDLQGFKKYVGQAPLRNSGTTGISMEFPRAKGDFLRFEVFKTTTMSPGLAAKFPSISSYVGVSKNKKYTLRFTVTKRGVYGMIMDDDGAVFINPMTRSGTVYKVFDRINATGTGTVMKCLVDNTAPARPVHNMQQKNLSGTSILWTYELAVATTGEFSQYHIAAAGLGGASESEQKTAVMAAIVVIMDRVNQIYERALSLTMELVPNNGDIIFLDGEKDPFSNDNANALIDESQTVIDDIIGFSNYDIGHTFSTGGGGYAQLFSPCTGGKARGVTGILAPIGDPFAIDYVAHEMGHQFGANHTFNSFCKDNRNNDTAVEPGSGITIMAYAGICIPNIAFSSIPFFHAVSISEMYANIKNGPANSCGAQSSISNTAPTIEPIPDYTIPYGTAFVLTASATDAEGDNLTYTWDQMDNEIAPMPPLPTSTVGPNFRSFEPVSSPSRYFPDLNSIFNGDLTPNWQVVPSVARTMDFTLTVRDNNLLGGQNATENLRIVFADTGPFVVTSQNAAGKEYDQNETVTITWDVAGTTANGINAAKVDILLSYAIGSGFSALASGVPNDGSQTITVPIGTDSPTCRLMVKGTDNVFFDINNEYFTITNEIMSTKEFTGTSFSVFPNPNNGEFTLAFDPSIKGDVKMYLYDIRGRLINSRIIDTDEKGRKIIKMRRPQTGMYFLQITKGSRKITKKLLVR